MMTYLSDECSKYLGNFYVLIIGSEYLTATFKGQNERFVRSEGLHSLRVVNGKVEA